jgi:hypothetical protein
MSDFDDNEEYEGMPKTRRQRNTRYATDNEVEGSSFQAFHHQSAFNQGDDDDELARMIRCRLRRMKEEGK